MVHASGEILLFVDVRQALDPDALRHLVANFADPTVGAVTGELRFLHALRVGEASDIDLYWRYELWARQQQSRIDSIFNTTGCIYAMRRNLAKPIPPDTLCDDAMIPLHGFLAGYRVIFDPEAVAFDYGQIAGGEFRRKLRTLAGVWQVWVRLPQLFSRKNRMRFHFLPHKFGRLLLPWLVLLGFAATLLMPGGPVRNSLLVGGLAGVLLALLDPLLPREFFLRRISSPAQHPRSASVMTLGILLMMKTSSSKAANAKTSPWRTTRPSRKNARPATATVCSSRTISRMPGLICGPRISLVLSPLTLSAHPVTAGHSLCIFSSNVRPRRV
jgi:cellulose synthase/poly-beta-1,6-N-acetylglucosamine synthase-like glycosyltransferase